MMNRPAGQTFRHEGHVRGLSAWTLKYRTGCLHFGQRSAVVRISSTMGLAISQRPFVS